MDLRNQVASLIAKETKLDKNQVAALLEVPPDPKMGDLAFPCFVLAKSMKKAPAVIAEELVKKLKTHALIAEVEASGPYLNFYFNKGMFAESVVKEVLKAKAKYGSSDEKGTVMMDVFQANPYKSFHIGHIRNAATGDSVRRILEFTGKNTVTVSYSGDVGIHVARWLLYYKKYIKGKIPTKNVIKWVGQVYAKSSSKGKEDEAFEAEAHELNRKLDARDPEIVKLWTKFRQLCYDEYKKIAIELGCKIDHWIPESICEAPGKKLVLDLYEKGKLTKSKGAIGLDLEKYDLGFFILLKSDGTALYSTKDLGLLQLKNKISSYDASVFVVASEQEFYFKQLFKVFEVLNLPNNGKHTHLSHGLVTLKEGKMASRLGNVILYEDLRDEMIELALKEVKKRNKTLSKKKMDQVAAKIAFGAMKYTMLKFGMRNLIKFDKNEALSFEGNTGPYLQYALVRANRILEKVKSAGGDLKLLVEAQEFELVKKISSFGDVVLKAAQSYSPHLIASYSCELAQLFSGFYESCPVNLAEEKLKGARFALVKAFAQTLKNALKLLGIDEVEVM